MVGGGGGATPAPRHSASAIARGQVTALLVPGPALAAVLDFGLPAGPGPVSARVVEVEGLQVSE